MTVAEIIELIEVSSEIHLYDRNDNKSLGMIPAVEDKNGKYTRQTDDWQENQWLYSDTVFPKKLKKEYSVPLLKKEVYCIFSDEMSIGIYI